MDEEKEITQGGVQTGPVATTDKGTSNRYSITRVQIKPGKRTIDPNQDERSANYLTRLPVLKPKAAPYVPMPYTFRVDVPKRVRFLDLCLGICPPFSVMVDHVIAVVWSIFSEGKHTASVGIAQLQWALTFLKTVHVHQGKVPKDVQVCIDAIEDTLADQYADLSEDIYEVRKLDEAVHYMEGALGSQSMVVKSIPFSLNYSEMINKSPAVAMKDSKLSMTSAEAKEELENLKKTAGVKSIENLDSVSKHRAINVLKAWKTEQLHKIRGELKRLRSIEDKMKDIDDNFEGYLEDDLEMLYKK